MRYLPTVLSLGCGLLLGCVLAASHKTEPSRTPERASRTARPEPEIYSPTDPGEIVAREIGLQAFDPSEAGDSELAKLHAQALLLAKRCREVPDEGLRAMFGEVVAMDTAVEKSLALRILGARWAKYDPQAGSETAAALESPQRALVERSLWQGWARRDLTGFRKHMEDLRQELGGAPPLGAPFEDPTPWFKADPISAMEAMLDKDWYFFREIYSMHGDAAPPEEAKPLPEPPIPGGRAWGGLPDMPPVLEQWFHSDFPSAMSWTREALSRESVPPRLRFHTIHHLNESGFHAEAAELAEKYLTEDLLTIANQRIQNRWSKTDPEAAEAWQNQPSS